jgi:DNA polymerase I-like protein with 3'-5' exonuclease and polymerase domains
VQQLEKETLAAREKILAELQAAGMVRANGSRDTKVAKARMRDVMGEDHRKTNSGDVCLDADACEASEDPLLEAYAEYSTLDKVLKNDIPALYKGTVTPIQTRYGLADTGRTTSSGPNIQNVRRLPGIRECFRPRPGYVYAQADYHAFELFALAQACKKMFSGESKLADALNAGMDPHTQMAADILGKSYDETLMLVKAKNHSADMARQTGKTANFGFPGGLGAKRLVEFAKKGYGVVISETEAKMLRTQWLKTWPEMVKYFNAIEDMEYFHNYFILLPKSGRLRGHATYTAACNSLFQGLAADAAKEALFRVSKACFVDKESPLYGSILVAFVHDEIICESPLDKAPEAAEELSRLMEEGAELHMPDMKLKAEPCLMTVWSKNARTLRDENGRLMPWSPTLDTP